MQRSGSQKALLVISIINIIIAVITLLAGVAIMMGGVLVGAADPAEVEASLAGSGITQGEAGIIAGILGIVALLSGVIQLILGILGVRAANDNQKIMPVWVIAIIELIFSAVGLGSSLANGSFSTNSVSIVVGLIMSFLVLWIANNIKRQAGK